MTDIEELEGRLAAALERIGAGVERMRAEAQDAPPAPDATALLSRVAVLEAELEEAQGARAALEESTEDERGAARQSAERLQQAQRRHELQVRRLQAEAEERAAALEEAEAALARQRRANDRLRETSEALRAAAAAGEPPPIDAALQAELEGLRAARTADRDEIDAILHELAPLLERGEDG